LNRLIVSAIHASNVGDSQNVQTLIEAFGSMLVMTASAGSAASRLGDADSAGALADSLGWLLGASLAALGAVLGVWPAQAETTNSTPSTNPRWRLIFVSIAPPWCSFPFKCFSFTWFLIGSFEIHWFRCGRGIG
jgi:hypothetical protein